MVRAAHRTDTPGRPPGPPGPGLVPTLHQPAAMPAAPAAAMPAAPAAAMPAAMPAAPAAAMPAAPAAAMPAAMPAAPAAAMPAVARRRSVRLECESPRGTGRLAQSVRAHGSHP